ncbi:MAG: MerR family transcriptional regulator [Methylovirgula sp.]
MEKSAQAFRTISEVAQDLDLPQHVLRFWETRFVQIRPLKRGGGRRYYRPEDIELLRAVRQLLYGEGYTIKGVQKILKEQGARMVAAAYGGAGVQPAALPAEGMTEGLYDGEDDVEANVSGPAADLDSEALREPRVGAFETVAPPAMPRAQIPQGRRAGVGPARPAPSPGDCAILQELLTDLVECTRILDAARGG